MTPTEHSRSLAAAITTLRADEVAANGAQVLDDRSIPYLLLRGASLTHWLYDDPAERTYMDADLLVPFDRVNDARRALLASGYSQLLADAAPLEQAPHAETFRAEGGGAIDLHWTLRGVGAEPDAVWDVLSDGSMELEVSSENLVVPRPGARAFIVALHTAQHGLRYWVQLQDVKRATERLPIEVWEDAAEIAERLDALLTFAAGLRTAERGEAVLHDLGISAGVSREIALRAQGKVPLIQGIERFSQTRGVKAKARLLARELLPTPTFMRAWSKLARRGSLGLAAAYAFRPLWLLWQLPPAYLAHRRARKIED